MFSLSRVFKMYVFKPIGIKTNGQFSISFLCLNIGTMRNVLKFEMAAD
jgi:hypothetical protein